ncbi:hypothetical protein D3C76_1691250 [compost metagenome]
MAKVAETIAIVRECCAACNRLSLFISRLYQLVVKPCQLIPNRELLNEFTIKMIIGMYRNA